MSFEYGRWLLLQGNLSLNEGKGCTVIGDTLVGVMLVGDVSAEDVDCGLLHDDSMLLL